MTEIASAPKPGPAQASAGRFWELDALRGLAVIAMIAYHAFFCANYIGLSPVNPYSGLLGVSPLFIAGAFLFISGVSMRLRRDNAASRGNETGFRGFARRSLVLAACAAVFTLVTLVAAGPESFVAFGVLHCLALSGILLYPFLRFRWLNLGLGLVIVLLGFIFLHGRAFPGFTWWFFFLGFRPGDYYPIDFVPLVPWTGFAFLGVFAASLLYKGGRRTFPWAFPGTGVPARFLSFLGRKSLVIYLVHIPVLLGILLLAKLLLK